MSLSHILAPTYLQMLARLSDWLGKAQVQMGDHGADALMSARLAPDMFPLSTQIRFACVQALEGMCRVHELDVPATRDELLNEGRNAENSPGNIANAMARIAETLAVVECAAGQEVEIDPASPIAHTLPQGMVFDLTAEQYVRDWALPQFYFHLMTAYAILRAQGVELGKADYVAHLFAHLRSGTTPGQ
jgi:uncharacterized protein